MNKNESPNVLLNVRLENRSTNSIKFFLNIFAKAQENIAAKIVKATLFFSHTNHRVN